jgi:hypothetical protein
MKYWRDGGMEGLGGMKYWFIQSKYFDLDIDQASLDSIGRQYII